MVLKNSKNLFEFDKDFNVPILIGTDEAGRGPGAGGVFASAVCFKNIDIKLIEELSALNDSKKLPKKLREELFEIIIQNSYHATVCIEVEEIEKINILNASLKAMRLACETLINQIEADDSNCRLGFSTQQKNVLILVDGNKLIKKFAYPQQFIIKGDGKSASIAAASILAKVSRDFYMQKLDEKYPNYNWKQNAGYLTREHLSAINRYGITPHHRCSFLKKYHARELEKQQKSECCLSEHTENTKEEICNLVQLNLYPK